MVQSVSPTLSVRRKIDNETIPKRDIVLADDSYVSLDLLYLVNRSEYNHSVMLLIFSLITDISP